MIIPIELRIKADKDSKSALRTEKTIKSHDINSVEFHISIDGLELTDNHTAKILSIFHTSKSQANVDCEIVEGKIIYKPDTDLISRHEHVTNYVYVYHNNQSLDVREFIYIVDLSKIDETSLEVKEVYDQSYADLLTDFEQALSDYKDNLPQADSVRADIDEILNQFSEDSQAKLSLIDEAEESRVQAEGLRESIESSRVQAETQRASSESSRVSAEADRVLAEQERVQGYQEIQQIIEDGELSAVPADGSITPEKTSFMNISTNLIDTESAVENKSIVSATGEVVETPGTHMVEYVVSPGEVYSRANTSRFFIYKSDGTYITPNTRTTYTMPPGAGIMRLTFTDSERETAQLNRGSVVLPYENPGATLKDEVNVPIKPKSVTEDKLADNSVGVAKLKSNSVDSLKLQNGSVSIEKTNFVGRSSNLYNPRTSLRGYGLLSTTGEPYKDPSYVSTPFYEGLAGEKITTKQFNRVLFYRTDKTFISRTEIVNYDTPYTFTMPQDGYYRLHGAMVYVDEKAQINKGDTLLDYEPYYLIIDGYKFEGDVDSESTTNPLEEKPHIFPPVDFDTTFKADDGTYTTFTLENLYTAYDELATAHHGYFTKTLVGKEQSGQYDVFRCRMKPREYSRNGSVRGKLPKITFIANIHGGEHPSALASYYMVKAICEDWQGNPVLEYLRHNVEFEFIPVANPYGYVTGEYKNSRGVNIQTNFPENWELRDNTDPNSSTYGGTEPLSEVESLYIKDLIDDNTDSVLFADLHSAAYASDVWAGGYDSLFYYIIPNGSQYNKNVEVATKYLAESNTRFLKKHYPINTDNFLGYYQLREGKGTVDSYATGVQGIPSVVIELFYKLPDETDNYSNDSIKASTEVLTNSLLTMLKQFKEAGQ